MSGFNFNNNDTMPPVGSIIAHTGNISPSGWLICDGSSYTTSNYPLLFNVIGYRYGGSGSTFNLPDLRDCLIRGSPSTTSLSASKLGSSTVTLTLSNLPSHAHTYQDVYYTEQVGGVTQLNNYGANDSNNSNQFIFRTTNGSSTANINNSETNISTTNTISNSGNATSTPTPFSIIPYSNIINYIIKI